MAEPKVRSDYESLARVATVFRQQADTARQMLQNVRSKMDVLRNGHWIGKGADVFYREMDSAVLPALGKLATALESAAETTTRISQIMREAEDAAARVLRGEGSGGAGAGGSGGAAAGGADLKSKIEGALKGPGVDVAALKSAIESASPAEREAIWKDSKLMEKLRSELSANEYLSILPALGVSHSGKVPQIKPGEADDYIRKHLKDHLGTALKDGRKITGSVSVVGDEDWDIAGKAHYGDRWEKKKKTLSGFVDKEGRVWIHKDNGSQGTLLHEAVHKYSDPDRKLRAASQPLNEGVTEYFTRKVNSEEGLKINRANYDRNYDTTSKLVKLVGEDAVAKAYFDGDVAGLKTAFLAKGKTEADWSNFLKHTGNKDWAKAEAILD